MAALTFIVLPFLCLILVMLCVKLAGKTHKEYQVICSYHGLSYLSSNRDICEHFVSQMTEHPTQYGITDKCKLTIKSMYVFDEDNLR